MSMFKNLLTTVSNFGGKVVDAGQKHVMPVTQGNFNEVAAPMQKDIATLEVVVAEIADKVGVDVSQVITKNQEVIMDAVEVKQNETEVYLAALRSGKRDNFCKTAKSAPVQQFEAIQKAYGDTVVTLSTKAKGLTNPFNKLVLNKDGVAEVVSVVPAVTVKPQEEQVVVSKEQLEKTRQMLFGDKPEEVVVEETQELDIEAILHDVLPKLMVSLNEDLEAVGKDGLIKMNKDEFEEFFLALAKKHSKMAINVYNDITDEEVDEVIAVVIDAMTPQIGMLYSAVEEKRNEVNEKAALEAELAEQKKKHEEGLAQMKALQEQVAALMAAQTQAPVTPVVKEETTAVVKEAVEEVVAPAPKKRRVFANVNKAKCVD